MASSPSYVHGASDPGGVAGLRAGQAERRRAADLRWLIRLGDECTPGMLNLGDVATATTPEELATLEALGAQLQFDAPTNIQFTSGTTGRPKGATLSHHNLLDNGYFIREALKLTPDEARDGVG